MSNSAFVLDVFLPVGKFNLSGLTVLNCKWKAHSQRHNKKRDNGPGKSLRFNPFPQHGLNVSYEFL